MQSNNGRDREPTRQTPQAQTISLVDFESEAFNREMRGLLEHCRDGLHGATPCAHGKAGAALKSILDVSIRRARDLYQGHARYSRREAVAMLEHFGLTAEQFKEWCTPTDDHRSSSGASRFRADQIGHTLALTVWAHADDQVFVEQCISELLLSAKDDPSIDLERVARQALVDLALGLRERFAGHRDRIPGAAVVGVDFL